MTPATIGMILLTLTAIMIVSIDNLDTEVPMLILRIIRSVNAISESGTAMYALVLALSAPLLVMPMSWFADATHWNRRHQTRELIEKWKVGRGAYESRQNGASQSGLATIVSTAVMYVSALMLLRVGSDKLLNIDIKEYIPYTDVIAIALGFGSRELIQDALYGISSDSYIYEGALCEYGSSYTTKRLKNWKLIQTNDPAAGDNAPDSTQLAVVEKMTFTGAYLFLLPGGLLQARGDKKNPDASDLFESDESLYKNAYTRRVFCTYRQITQMCVFIDCIDRIQAVKNYF